MVVRGLKFVIVVLFTDAGAEAAAVANEKCFEVIQSMNTSL